MNYMKIDTHNCMTVVKELKSYQEVVGGWMEIVRPRGFDKAPIKGLVMVIDEEGKLKGLSQNQFGTQMYGTQGGGIVGPLLICKEVMTDEGPDIEGFDDREFETLMSWLNKVADYVKPETKERKITIEMKDDKVLIMREGMFQVEEAIFMVAFLTTALQIPWPLLAAMLGDKQLEKSIKEDNTISLGGLKQ